MIMFTTSKTIVTKCQVKYRLDRIIQLGLHKLDIMTICCFCVTQNLCQVDLEEYSLELGTNEQLRDEDFISNNL